MKTQVFAHKGIVGINSSRECDGIVKPSFPWDPMMVVEIEHVEISKEALDLLKGVPVGEEEYSAVDVFEKDGHKLFAFYGPKGVLNPKDFKGSRDYNADLFTETTEIEAPKDFKDYIEKEYEDVIG